MIRLVKKRKYTPNVAKENFSKGQKVKVLFTMPEGGGDLEDLEAKYGTLDFIGKITDITDDGKYEVSISETLDGKKVEKEFQDFWIAEADDLKALERRSFKRRGKVAKESFKVGDKVEIMLVDELGNDPSISALKRQYGTTSFIAEIAGLDGDDYRINLLTTKSGKPIDDEDLKYDWQAEDSELKPVTERRTKRLKRVNVSKENRKFRKRQISVESKRIKTMLNFSK